MSAMKETVTFKPFGAKSYRVREWKSIVSANNTLVVGSSIVKEITNDKFDCISISGGRSEVIALYVESLGNQIELYNKVCLMLGGNNLRDWKKDVAESTMTVSKLQLVSSHLGIIMDWPNAPSVPVYFYATIRKHILYNSILKIIKVMDYK